MTDLGAYLGGNFTVILAVVKFIFYPIMKFYSDTTIIHDLYKVKIEKKKGVYDESFKISDS